MKIKNVSLILQKNLNRLFGKPNSIHAFKEKQEQLFCVRDISCYYIEKLKNLYSSNKHVCQLGLNLWATCKALPALGPKPFQHPLHLFSPCSLHSCYHDHFPRPLNIPSTVPPKAFVFLQVVPYSTSLSSLRLCSDVSFSRLVSYNLFKIAPLPLPSLISLSLLCFY